MPVRERKSHPLCSPRIAPYLPIHTYFTDLLSRRKVWGTLIFIGLHGRYDLRVSSRRINNDAKLKDEKYDSEHVNLGNGGVWPHIQSSLDLRSYDRMDIKQNGNFYQFISITSLLQSWTILSIHFSLHTRYLTGLGGLMITQITYLLFRHNGKNIGRQEFKNSPLMRKKKLKREKREESVRLIWQI